jgi:hypothetical protein
MGTSRSGVSKERRILAGEAGDRDINCAREGLPPRSREDMLAPAVVPWEIRNMELNQMLEEARRIKNGWGREVGEDIHRLC